MADQPPSSPRRIVAALGLSVVAGFVDAFSYLTLSNVYTATMSGNTVLIAVHGTAGETPAALLHAFTIGVFVLGLLVSAVAIELGQRCGVRRVFAMALAIEAACLAAFALWGAAFVEGGALGTPRQPHWPLYALIALTGMAMGIQNTSLRMAGILTIFTTHVTGTLTRFGEQLVNCGFALADRRARRGSRNDTPPSAYLGNAAFSGGLWLAFFAGALLSAEMLPRWGIGLVLCLPIGALVVVAAADLIRPMAEPKR